MKKDLNIEIGARLRAQREKLGVKREAMAEELGFSTRYLAMVETGTAGVSLEGLKIFSVRYGISIDYIVLGLEDKNFRNITEKLIFLHEHNPEHIENIDTIIEKYVAGLKIK